MTWQPAAVLAPDAEMWACEYLRTALGPRPEGYASDVFVGNAVPKQRRDRMVIVRRDGGIPTEVFDQPRLSVRTWGQTEQDATDLARMVSALLVIAPGDGVCTRVRQASGPTSVPDESKQFLRYAVYEVTLRGEDLT